MWKIIIVSCILQDNDNSHDIRKLIDLAGVSAGQIKMQENGERRLLVKKKKRNNQEIHL